MTAVAVPVERAGGWTWPLGRALAAVVECTKPGISRLVVVTSAVGFAAARFVEGPAAPSAWVAPLLSVVVGTWLAASGANALNTWMEADLDARMQRTAGRPIPSGRLRPRTVFAWGLVLGLSGVLVLLGWSGAAPALVGLACIVSYVLVYTPMKTRTPWCTLVGAVPGALPPMIGAAAAAPSGPASGILNPMGVSLAALMLVWQIPHFMAIAQRYREDYRRAGMRMLPCEDPQGRKTATVTCGTAALLLVASVVPLLTADGTLGWIYGVTAGVSGLAFLLLCLRMAGETGEDVDADRGAKRVFFASIAHLPLLLVALVVDGALGRLL